MNDVFGKCCALEDHRRKQRRAATIDRSYLKSALEMMRREIDWIPDDCKRALLDAQTKCQPEELSDRRLEAFLRCVDWHPKVSWTNRPTVDTEAPYAPSPLADIPDLSHSYLSVSVPCCLEGRRAIRQVLGEASSSLWPGQVALANDS